MKIKKIEAFQVFDSRGFPTLEAEVYLDNGTTGRAIVPSGASTGRFEALELRDGDLSRFNGKSVFKAIGNIIEKIAPVLEGQDVHEQEKLDELMCELDGSANKQNLGANAILGVSMAIARANAANRGLPLYESLTDGTGSLLPLPEIQIIGGGAHTGGRIDIQDFMIICSSAERYEECLEMTFNVFQECGKLLKSRGKLAGVADEGGYWPVFDRNEDVFDILLEAIEAAGYTPGSDIHLSLDIAASEFYRDGNYHLSLENRLLTSGQFYDLIAGWCDKYPILSIEDPFAEADTENWKKLTENFGSSIQIIGDDLFTTDLKRVKAGYEQKLANSVLIKLNQIGTVSETIACIRQTQDLGWAPVVSARSGETEDPFIAHLAVATNAGQLKVGSFTRSERMVKWNEVIRISRQLGNNAKFKGAAILPVD
ncbi:MAG: phosphopyruvate hydratase [Balneolaceae bacterium]